MTGIDLQKTKKLVHERTIAYQKARVKRLLEKNQAGIEAQRLLERQNQRLQNERDLLRQLVVEQMNRDH